MYRFFDAQGRLLYVGVTVAGLARWTAHASTQPWWTDVASARIAHFQSVELALLAEVEAIRTEHPAYNIIHRFPREPRPEPALRRSSGSVYQRTSDRRWVAARSTGPRGHRQTVIRYATSREDAERALADLG